MRSLLQWVGVVMVGMTAAALGSHARAGMFDKLDYDRATQPPIKVVAVIPLHESRSVAIRNVGSAASHASALILPLGLGLLVGGAAEVGADAENTKRFVQALNERKAGFAVALANAVRAELLKNGMRFVYLANQRVSLTEDKKDLDFNRIGTNADVIMYVTLGQTGYVSSQFSRTYEPRAVVGVKIVDARNRKPVFARLYCAGCPDATRDVQVLPTDVASRFDSFDRIMEGLDQAAEGIRAEHRKIAALIVQSIVPPGEVKPIAAPAAEAAIAPASGTQ